MDDNGFLLIGRDIKPTVPPDIDCQIIRTNFNGDTLWTKRFGNSTNEWLESVISKIQNEFVIQGSEGFPNETEKSILIKINSVGQILDSRRVERFLIMKYLPLKFCIKAKRLDADHITISTIESNKLFY